MATSVQTGKAKQLTLLGFFAITASMVMAVYEYPTFATSGFSLVFFLLLGGILWFIPVGLCAAEMATVDGWEEGEVSSLGYQILWGRDGDLQRSHLAICKSPLVLFRCSISC